LNILVLNAGSSTLKFRLFRMSGEPALDREAALAEGIVDRIGTQEASLRLSVADRPEVVRPVPAETHGQAAEEAIRGCLPQGVEAIGHRIVHGGERFVEPTRITPAVIEDVRALSRLAPLHNPAGLAGIEAGLRLLPETPAVAVFDTAFHRTLPEVAATYALPLEFSARYGLRRYGFHGISHRYISERLLQCLGRDAPGTRLITCHLGNGASVCAVRDGRSVDTSMGLTPLEGLVMGTRCGDLDPGLVLHLLRACGMTPEEVEDLLQHQSGLRGLSGRTGDARDLEQAAAGGDRRAELALEIFAYRVRKYLGAYAAALEGLDAIAFTGGIGEHSAVMRARICRGLEFLGLLLDSDRNRLADSRQPARLSAENSPVQIWAIPTEEEWQIAREAYVLLQTPPGRC